MKACYPWSKINVKFSSSNKNEFEYEMITNLWEPNVLN